MRTRDGVRLDADVYRPEGKGPFPVLLMRQPYGRRIASTVCYAHPSWYADQGYIVVIQDVRGRGTREVWVSSATGGGASTFDARDPNWRRPWRLPAGSLYPDTLRLWNDNNPPGHWTFAPAYDMPLADFKAGLAKVGPWQKMFP